ncbi:unnamed protein product [Spodoptera exigua]|nr:unnamed protein product [Spodoptera exigua]
MYNNYNMKPESRYYIYKCRQYVCHLLPIFLLTVTSLYLSSLKLLETNGPPSLAFCTM